MSKKAMKIKVGNKKNLNESRDGRIHPSKFVPKEPGYGYDRAGFPKPKPKDRVYKDTKPDQETAKEGLNLQGSQAARNALKLQPQAKPRTPDSEWSGNQGVVQQMPPLGNNTLGEPEPVHMNETFSDVRDQGRGGLSEIHECARNIVNRINSQKKNGQGYDSFILRWAEEILELSKDGDEMGEYFGSKPAGWVYREELEKKQ